MEIQRLVDEINENAGRLGDDIQGLQNAMAEVNRYDSLLSGARKRLQESLNQALTNLTSILENGNGRKPVRPAGESLKPEPVTSGGKD